MTQWWFCYCFHLSMFYQSADRRKGAGLRRFPVCNPRVQNVAMWKDKLDFQPWCMHPERDFSCKWLHLNVIILQLNFSAAWTSRTVNRLDLHHPSNTTTTLQCCWPDLGPEFGTFQRHEDLTSLMAEGRSRFCRADDCSWQHGADIFKTSRRLKPMQSLGAPV